MNIHLTDLDEEDIEDFIKDREELCDKTKEHIRTMPERIACGGKDLLAATSSQ